MTLAAWPAIASAYVESSKMTPSFPSRLLESLLHPRRNGALKDQAVRQMASGAVATLADLCVYKMLLMASAHVLLAALIAVFSGAAVNFTITRYYVYGEVGRQSLPAKIQMLLYAPAVAVAIGITQLILYLLSVRRGLDPMLVRIFVCVPVVYFWTLLSGKYLIFNKRRDPDGERGDR